MTMSTTAGDTQQASLPACLPALPRIMQAFNAAPL